VISLLGFFGMRLAIKKINLLTEIVKKAAIDKEDEKRILELTEEGGEVGELAKSFIRNLKGVEKREQQPKETKEMIYDILKKASEVLTVVNNHDDLIRLVLETAADALGANQAALFSVEEGYYTLKAWVGKDDVTPEQVMDAAQVYLDQMTRENRFFLIPAKETSEQSNMLFNPPLIFFPLVRNEIILGALCFCGNSYWNNFSNDHMPMVVNLSHQLAASFDSAKMNIHSNQTSFETLAALSLAVESRDPYSRGHSYRVGAYAQRIGQLMGLSAEDIKTIRDASMLHDIGKIGIGYGILVKQGKLGVEEKSVIRNHPVVGESIALHLKEYQHLLDPIRHHHEMLDGSGYPDGLKNGEISRVTRVLSVADLFDTLMENRSYRSGMDIANAKKELSYFEKTRRIDRAVVNTLYYIIDNENAGKISGNFANIQ
jgi:HD-GYP domain-containing protein (c-di-GMP phosphodiesterase class II)